MTARQATLVLALMAIIAAPLCIEVAFLLGLAALIPGLDLLEPDRRDARRRNR